VARKVGSLPRTNTIGSSGASRGCPTRDSEGGESSRGDSLSAFAVGSDCTSILAVKIDMIVTCAIMRPRRGVEALQQHECGPKMQKVKGTATDRGKE